MEPDVFVSEDFTVKVIHPKPPSGTWGRIKEFFLHPDQVEVRTDLHDHVEMPETARQQVVTELRAEFGHMRVHATDASRRWTVTVFMEPEVYASSGIDYVQQVISQAVDHAYRATDRG